MHATLGPTTKIHQPQEDLGGHLVGIKSQHRQNTVDDAGLVRRAPVHALHQRPRLGRERRQRPPAVVERAGRLDARDREPLDVAVRRALLEDAGQLDVRRVRAYAVDDGERELALGQVLAEPLVLAVGVALQVEIVVPDLEDEPQDVDQRNVVAIEAGFSRQSRPKRMYREPRITHRSFLLASCMSLTANLKRPPVLLDTIVKYSSSVGQMDASLQ